MVVMAVALWYNLLTSTIKLYTDLTHWEEGGTQTLTVVINY